MYIDLHSHYLPGVDDGSPDIYTSLAWLLKASLGGIKEIALTPHVSPFYFGRGGGANPSQFVPQTFTLLEEAARVIDVKLHCGGELSSHCAIEQTRSELDCIALGPEGNKWILLEASLFSDFDKSFSRSCDHLRNLGYDILIAHPERSPTMAEADSQKRLLSEIEQGALVQVNLVSLNSRSSQIRDLAHLFVEDGICYCIASDIHPPTRPNFLFELPDHLERAGLDPSLAVSLGRDNPAKLLNQGF